jgi:hypothetical protein
LKTAITKVWEKFLKIFFIFCWQIIYIIHVRYHNDGSKKLNACIQFFLHLVYF